MENTQVSKRVFHTALPRLLMPGEPLAALQPDQTSLSCSCGKEVDVSPYFIILTLALVTTDQSPSGNGDPYNDIDFNDKSFYT